MTLLGHHSGNSPVGVEETKAESHSGEVPKAYWKIRAMSTSDELRVFVLYWKAMQMNRNFLARYLHL